MNIEWKKFVNTQETPQKITIYVKREKKEMKKKKKFIYSEGQIILHNDQSFGTTRSDEYFPNRTES